MRLFRELEEVVLNRVVDGVVGHSGDELAVAEALDRKRLFRVLPVQMRKALVLLFLGANPDDLQDETGKCSDAEYRVIVEMRAILNSRYAGRFKVPTYGGVPLSDIISPERHSPLDSSARA